MDFSFTEYLILVLIGLLFFKEQLLQWVGYFLGKKWGVKNDKPEWANELIGHFNHETTDLLEKLLASQEGELQVHNEIIRGNEKIVEKLDKILIDGVKIRQ